MVARVAVHCAGLQLEANSKIYAASDDSWKAAVFSHKDKMKQSVLKENESRMKLYFRD